MSEQKYSNNDVANAIMIFPEMALEMDAATKRKFFEDRYEDFLIRWIPGPESMHAWYDEVEAALEDYVYSNIEALRELTYPIAEKFLDEKYADV